MRSDVFQEMMLVQHNILVFRKANNRRDSVNKSESGMKKYLNDYAYLLIGLYLYGGALNLNADSLCTLEQTHTEMRSYRAGAYKKT